MGNNDSSKRLLMSVAMLSGFVLIVIAMLLSYVLASRGGDLNPVVLLLFQYHLELMIIVSILGIAVGASMFFLTQGTVELKTREAAGNANLLLTFLSNDERQVVELLVKSEGHTTQSQISKLEGMTRLKAHRTVLRLAGKKIIRVEKLGKINQLWLAKSVFDALSGNGEHGGGQPNAA